MSDDVREAIAFQTDVFGQRCNDMFLAEFADSVRAHVPSTLPWNSWVSVMVDHQLNPQAWDYEPTLGIESALADEGYEVEWNNGVFIYQAEDDDDE
jgi:hypothetical protein